MANTYFNMWIDPIKNADNQGRSVSLTAFVGGEKSTQLTIGRYPWMCVMLSDNDAERLASALMERVNGKISATGSEVSEFTDDEEEEDYPITEIVN